MTRYIIVAGLIFFAFDSAQADQVLDCTPHGGNLPTVTLLVEGAPDKPSQIVWPGWAEARRFVVRAFTDSDYTAIEQRPNAEIPSGQIYVNRLNGELTLENYISHEARKILVKLCDGQITGEACQKQQETVEGGNLFACIQPEHECPRWKNGSNLLSIFVYSCVQDQRKF